MEYHLYGSALEMLKSMIAIPSHSREEARVAGLLENYLIQQSRQVHRRGNNLWVVSPDFDASKPTILLNSHIDTVRPVAGWTTDPYLPLQDSGKLTGLGSNDAGASVVSLLQVFLYLTQKQQSYNLIFLASCEEEVSGKNGIESVLPDLPPISFALVGEPTGMHPAIAEKGLMVLDCVVYGKAGHAALDEGINAIYKAKDCLDWFKTYEFPLASEWLGRVKMSVTMIQAGTQHNVVPDRCAFTVDVRTNECYDNHTLYKMIQSMSGCDEVNARSFRLNASSIPLHHPMVERAVLQGRLPFGSSTLSDQALMPFPSLKMGPGDSARSHTAGEFIWLNELEEAIRIYIQLLDRF